MKYTTETFIEKAEKIHGDKYDYSLVDYIKWKVKVKIKCKIHGTFEQEPSNHLQGQGCKKCGLINSANKQRKSKKQFIIESKEIHGDKYDYSLVDYITINIKVKIICNQHGCFEQTPGHHLKGVGCSICNGGVQLNTEKFIIKSREKHGDRYDYSQTIYKNAREKVKIICKKHGEFLQVPHSHFRGTGCPECAKTYGGKFNDRYLYLFYDEIYNLYKIGVSYKPERRIKKIMSRDLNEDLISNIVLYKKYEKKAKYEKTLHKHFSNKQQNHPIFLDGKTEWFKLNKNDLLYIDNLIKSQK